MSTPRLEPDALPLADDQSETALITRLAKELFAERSGAAPALESAEGSAGPTPGIPTAIAGIPSTPSGTAPTIRAPGKRTRSVNHFSMERFTAPAQQPNRP